MEWNDVISLHGNDYKFEYIEDEPLTLIMKIDESYHIQRDIDCDGPFEHMRLIQKYISVRNCIPKDDIFVTEVYRGKEIESAKFMKELLEHILHGIINNKI